MPESVSSLHLDLCYRFKISTSEQKATKLLIKEQAAINLKVWKESNDLYVCRYVEESIRDDRSTTAFRACPTQLNTNVSSSSRKKGTAHLAGLINEKYNSVYITAAWWQQSQEMKYSLSNKNKCCKGNFGPVTPSFVGSLWLFGWTFVWSCLSYIPIISTYLVMEKDDTVCYINGLEYFLA